MDLDILGLDAISTADGLRYYLNPIWRKALSLLN
jgi:hypothetical protein